MLGDVDPVERIDQYVLQPQHHDREERRRINDHGALGGRLVRKGEGILKDEAEAVRLYRLAADKGLARARLDLGRMYARGEGVAQDEAEAVRWYRLAAERGHAPTQYKLGRMYANGDGVFQDEAEAVRLYRLAAKKGHARAQYDLGLSYANGAGVLKDPLLAHMWLRSGVTLLARPPESVGIFLCQEASDTEEDRHEHGGRRADASWYSSSHRHALTASIPGIPIHSSRTDEP